MQVRAETSELHWFDKFGVFLVFMLKCQGNLFWKPSEI